MPPFIPQQRRQSNNSRPSLTKKPTLFETADKPDNSATLQENSLYLETLESSEDLSSIGQTSSDEFEDALTVSNSGKAENTIHGDDDDQVWEDAMEPAASPSLRTPAGVLGDIELNLDQTSLADSTTHKGRRKGPSKIERQVRVATHCMHVQCLLFHNAIRNGWACDAQVQSILVSQLPANVEKEIERWKHASGINSTLSETPSAATCRNASHRRKYIAQERSQRDWGKPAQKEEKGVPDMSRGDPLIRLLNILATYWKKRFTINAPGLRKQGYRTLSFLQKEIATFQSGPLDVEQHGERIDGIEAFRKIALIGEGSRDVGSQLFTALIRGLGLEARLVSNLQCVGFGWSKNEEALHNQRKKVMTNSRLNDDDNNGSSNKTNETSSRSDEALNAVTAVSDRRASTKGHLRSEKSSNGTNDVAGAKGAPIRLFDDSSDDDEHDDDSVIDTTPAIHQNPRKNYDRDLLFPVYWTEVISPITNQVIPVEPLVLKHAVATNAEHIAQFEPRGARADKTKQIFAYVVAHAPDGSAKDVTVRYLKRHLWPGRTRGVRFPPEKVPVYDERGKIKHYGKYDWFKTTMRGYTIDDSMKSAVDDIEDAIDLKSIKPEKVKSKTSEETLQGYKSSANYVLERHLRREEALIPNAKPVKSFVTGKGENLKQEPVYRRKDVEICRTRESWHKEGRAVKAGEHPLKMVPIRAVTLTRKREVEEAERDGGEKLKQGLYAWHQTDWIIPPPIQDGIIPRNSYGNIDCFVQTMVPKGAVHIPLRSTVKICKRMGIDYAEAVTGFEFGNKRAVPVINGVVVAEDNEKTVIDAWQKDEEERRIREEGKREKMALSMWRKWLMGLRIRQRIHEEYGNSSEKEDANPFTNSNKARRSLNNGASRDASADCDCPLIKESEVGGGFLAHSDEDSEGSILADPRITSQELMIEDKAKVHSQGLSNLPSKNTTPALKEQREGASGNVSDLARGKKRKASGGSDLGKAPSGVGKTSTAMPQRKSARRSAQSFKGQYCEQSSVDGESG